MHPAESATTFEAAVSATGKTVEELDAPAALAQMEEFYRNVRAEDCILDEEGDTLQCQWGVNTQGGEKTFQLEIARHFIEPGDEDEDGMSQLSLTLTYPADPALLALEPGVCQCSLPTELGEFERAVLSSRPYQTLATLKPQQTSLMWWQT
ncbi:MAG: hypothetical protein J0L73_00150 [Verrucomicrobia bacterium]|nr:hypothetical protein [Verrucomicrobiota bacterium]